MESLANLSMIYQKLHSLALLHLLHQQHLKYKNLVLALEIKARLEQLKINLYKYQLERQVLAVPQVHYLIPLHPRHSSVSTHHQIHSLHQLVLYFKRNLKQFLQPPLYLGMLLQISQASDSSLPNK